MAHEECPYCRSTRTLSGPWVLARRCAIAALVTFWIGLLAMLVLILVGLPRLGGWVWLVCTISPLLVFLVEHKWRRRRDSEYLASRHCLSCGRRWTSSEATAVTDSTRPDRSAATQERLRWLERQRQEPAEPSARPGR